MPRSPYFFAALWLTIADCGAREFRAMTKHTTLKRRSLGACYRFPSEWLRLFQHFPDSLS